MVTALPASSYSSGAPGPAPSVAEDGPAAHSGGCTALHVAALHQRRALLPLLVAAGADVRARDAESGWTAMHRALYRGDFLTAAMLAQLDAGSGTAAAQLTDADPAAFTPLDLVHAHVREASYARRARLNGSGRVAAAVAGQQRRSGRSSEGGIGGGSAFAALADGDAADTDSSQHNLLYSFGFQTQWTLGEHGHTRSLPSRSCSRRSACA
jgi:hypothetical protein